MSNRSVHVPKSFWLLGVLRTVWFSSWLVLSPGSNGNVSDYIAGLSGVSVISLTPGNSRTIAALAEPNRIDVSWRPSRHSTG